MFGHNFYHATTRRYISVFGTLFNDIKIDRIDDNDTTRKTFMVPISYGPRQKFLARIQEDPDLDQPTAITLPRMSFEMTNMVYDPERQLTRTTRNTAPRTGNNQSYLTQFVPTPYNLDFQLSIYAKYSEDATKILENILPFFTPEWTPSIAVIDALPNEYFDVPIVLNSVTSEEVYEGNFTDRRVVIWNLTFTLKGYYFGPTTNKAVIKFANTNFYTDVANGSWSDTATERVRVYPALIANSAVHWSDINYDDDWEYVVIIEDL